jgi:lysophospholipase L1-like esterase
MKIIFFGDSLTQGTYGISYVNKVARQLLGHHFVNQGANGDTSLNLYRRLDRDVIVEKPDGVFIMIGINDATSCSDPGARTYLRYFKQVRGGQVTPIALRENMRAILTKLRIAPIKTWVALPPIENRPESVAVLREMNQFTRDVCHEFNIPTLDLMAQLTPESVPERPAAQFLPAAFTSVFRALTLNTEGYERLRVAGNYHYSFDGIHLTEKGAQHIADAITFNFCAPKE